MIFNMKKLLALFLILPISISAEEQTFEECVDLPPKEASTADYEACFTKFNVISTSDCVELHMNQSGKSKEESQNACTQLSMQYDIEIYTEDRPTEFYDIFSNLNRDGYEINSYGCSLPQDEEGMNQYNALIIEYDEAGEIVSEDWTLFKAMIHVVEGKDYAEVNFGSSIFPLAEYRFFTNSYRTDGTVYSGVVDGSDDSLMKAGTDRGDYGRAWVINTKEDILTIYMGNHEIGFLADCGWSKDLMDEDS